MLHTCQSKSGCTNEGTIPSDHLLNYLSTWWFCPEHENPEWVVIGYNTRDENLPLFKVNNIFRESVKDLQDSIAADQAVRFPHIIYSVVRSSDLWW